MASAVRMRCSSAVRGILTRLTGFRENLDMAFIFRLHADDQVRAVTENYLGHQDRKTAKNILDAVVWKDQSTEQRQFLVVDQSGNSQIDHMLYAGQATDPGRLRLGSPEWWKKLGQEIDDDLRKDEFD